MLLSSFAIVKIEQEQLTLSVVRSFDSSSALYYKWSIVTMRLFFTIIEIWRLKDNGVTTLIFWGHVTSSVTWPSTRGGRLLKWSIVTMRLSCTVMEIWHLKCWTHGRTDGRSGDFILCPMLRIALDKQQDFVINALKSALCKLDVNVVPFMDLSV